MKKAAMVRRVDELGRIVLPIELRRTLDIEERDLLEIHLDKDCILLRKYMPCCTFCGAERGLQEYRGKQLCQKCLQELAERVE
ncbi:MAG: AbrB/MazE/SpoVT family DNA-binding domain-containing protein [Oscillospiraceae bacterium]|jgi:transcriptional pleiotropic regulator of transition state genes|nr:AbrB/MazE/SpoVT family DNA-binding domain-containing protein [Oscillospiraceae bacterium]